MRRGIHFDFARDKVRCFLEVTWLGSVRIEASSTIGSAPVSKTGGWGFDSLLACHFAEGR